MSAQTPPRFVALNGFAEVGKSTVQRMIEHHYAIVPADDGKPLREAVKALYSLDDWHVYTHEGKRSTVDLPNGPRDIRQLLGDIGLKLDELHGPEFIPWAAIRAAEKPYRDAAVAEFERMEMPTGVDGLPSSDFRANFVQKIFDRTVPVFSFGSVRREQARTYQAQGGVAVEIWNPAKPEPDKDFDRYNRALCDATIVNDTPGLAALEAKVLAVFDPWFTRVSTQAFAA